MENVRSHNSGRAQRCIEASRAERLPHPAYSPGLAPSDFFLFGDIKGKLFNYTCESLEELVNASTEIFAGADDEVLPAVFESMANGLKWVIKHEGKYDTE
jgi:hypothetical protein